MARLEFATATSGDLALWAFRLYVAGRGDHSEVAEGNLRSLCDNHLAGGYELDVIDVSERPDLAEAERILATPTVVRDRPPPQRRVIGDLSDGVRAAVALGMPARAQPHPEEPAP